MTTRILTGDCRTILAAMLAATVDCVVTSPPYWGLRDYGTASWQGGDPGCRHMQSVGASSSSGLNGSLAYKDGRVSTPFRHKCGKCGAIRVDRQLGMEATLGEHITTMVAVFEDVRRVLKPSGTLWLNYGDCYAASVNGRSAADTKTAGNDDRTFRDKPFSTVGGALKPKDLCMVPNRLAIALQEAGWWVRSEIIWAKPNPMPESVRDRPTSAHEKIWLLTKSERYFYDAEAIAEPSIRPDDIQTFGGQKAINSIIPSGDPRFRNGAEQWGRTITSGSTRNRRNVWTIPSQPFSDAHFATFPPALVEPCVLAGCPQKVCAKCGRPWVRRVQQGYVKTHGDRTPKQSRDASGLDAGQDWNEFRTFSGAKITTTLGFRPSCHCKAATVPGTVLDPFGGAGTVGMVADRLGRDAILIELNPAYATMAQSRIVNDLPLFAEVLL